MLPARVHWLEVAVLCAAFILANLAGAKWQKRVSYHDGKGWEGVRYYQVAEEISQHEHIAAEAPFVFRVGTPFLAAHVPGGGDLFFKFTLVNLIANALSLALLIAWLRHFIALWAVRTALGLIYVIQWDAPIRFLWFSPVHTDPWMWVFLLTGLLATLHLHMGAPKAGRWLAFFCVSSFLGAMVREVTLIVPLAALFLDNPVHGGRTPAGILSATKRPRAVLFLPLICGLVALCLVSVSVTKIGAYSFVWTAQHWIYGKALPSMIHPWLLAFGPVLFLAVFDWRRAGKFLWENQALAIYLLGCAVLGYIGGSDSERLSYWCAPVVFILIGRAIEKHWDLLRSWPLLATLVICQLISARAFFIIPDYPNDHPARSWPLFTPGLGNHFDYFNTYSILADHEVIAASLAEYLLLGLILWEWLNYRRKHALVRH